MQTLLMDFVHKRMPVFMDFVCFLPYYTLSVRQVFIRNSIKMYLKMWRSRTGTVAEQGNNSLSEGTSISYRLWLVFQLDHTSSNLASCLGLGRTLGDDPGPWALLTTRETWKSSWLQISSTHQCSHLGSKPADRRLMIFPSLWNLPFK